MTLGTARARWILAVAPALVAALLSPQARGEEGGDRPKARPRFEREAPGRRAPPGTPREMVLPEALVMRAAAAREGSSTPGQAVYPEEQLDEAGAASGAVPSRPGEPPAGRPPEFDLEQTAARAGAWTAREVARGAGWRQYYRVGLHFGLRAALDDESLGAWDYDEGLRLGSLDPDARAIGLDEGERAAEEAASEAARAQVESEFVQLRREPRFAPDPNPPAYASTLRWAEEPRLSEIFEMQPWTRVAEIRTRAAVAFEGWNRSPWQIYRAVGYADVYDPGWSLPDRAFDFWRSDPRRAAIYLGLRSAWERQRFEAVFKESFASHLPLHFESHLRAAFRQGVEDGWTYGALVSYEWHFRLGYTAGFDRAAAAVAAAAFARAYPPTFGRRYGEAFADWSGRPAPAILSVRLLDAGDDGVFQPGEEILVEFEAANYGGRAGTFRAWLEGPVIEGVVTKDVSLPARDLVRSAGDLRARISPGAPARAKADLDFRIGDLSTSVGLLVAYPLELLRDVGLETRPLEGRATVLLRATNVSSKPVAGGAGLQRLDRPGPAETRELGVLPPGAEGSATFQIEGLDPLDVISGAVRLRLTAASGGAVHDEMEFRFPETATDLGRRDLLDLLLDLSRRENVPRADVAEARALVLRRVEADWHASASGSGNPYKEDYKRHGRLTALGDLVETYLGARRAIRSREVFAGLGDEVASLAERLPGAHPLLRKYVRKLAGRLG